MQVFYEAVLTAEEWNVLNVDTNEFVYETTRKDRS